MFSFHELEMKFGAAIAWHCLMEIERAARIRSFEVAELDPETRLVMAFHAQDGALQQAA